MNRGIVASLVAASFIVGWVGGAYRESRLYNDYDEIKDNAANDLAEYELELLRVEVNRNESIRKYELGLIGCEADRDICFSQATPPILNREFSYPQYSELR